MNTSQGPERANDQLFDMTNAQRAYVPSMQDHLATLDHYLARLPELAKGLHFAGLRRKICEDILPLISKLEDNVNRH